MKCLSYTYYFDEYVVSKFLFDHNIPYWYAVTLPELDGLHLDFVIPVLNIAIEMNGQQHFEPVKCFGGSKGFKYQQIRDNDKKLYCKLSGIKLININNRGNIQGRPLIAFINKILNKHLVPLVNRVYLNKYLSCCTDYLLKPLQKQTKHLFENKESRRRDLRCWRRKHKYSYKKQQGYYNARNFIKHYATKSTMRRLCYLYNDTHNEKVPIPKELI